jgi:putative ABC transport system permease protein
VLRRWRRALRALLRRDEASREMDAEFASHLEFAVAELVAQGVPEEEARRRARVEFGSVPAARAEAVAQRPLFWVQDLARDLRLSLRQFRRSPVATASLVLTAAIGIGGLSAVFTVINAAWLRPLPYPDAAALHSVQGVSPNRFVQRALPVELAHAIREHLQQASRVALFAANISRVVTPSANGLTAVTQVDSALLSVLGVRLAAGRLPTTDEYAREAPVALVRDSVWRKFSEMDRRTEVATIAVDGRDFHVIGAFDDAMHFPERSEVWLPMQGDVAHRELLIRREASVSADSLSAAIAAVQRDPRGAGWRLWATDIVDRGYGRQIAIAFAMLVALAMMLAVATASNVSLQLVAAAQRRRAELATAAALGATAQRIARRLLADQVIVIGLAGVLGTVLAQVGLRAVQSVVSAPWPGWVSLEVDWRIVLASVGFTAATLLLVGLLPAREGRRIDPIRVMREGGVSGVTALGTRRNAARLLAVQVALSVLLTGIVAVLVLANRQAFLAATHPGDEARLDVAAFGSSAVPRTAAEDAVLLDALADTLRRRGLATTARFAMPYQLRFATAPRALVRVVDDDFLAVDDRIVVAGRRPRADVSTAQTATVPEALVSESYVRAAGLSIDAALGQPLVARRSDAQFVIVGVVADRGHVSSTAPAAPVEIFLRAAADSGRRERLLIQAQVPLDSVRRTLRAVADKLAPHADLGRLASIHDEHELQLLPMRLALRAVTAAALAVLLISLVGLHGLVAQVAESRRAEAGIRSALGATAWQVARRLIAQSWSGVVLGFALGTLLSAAAALVLLRSLGLPPASVALALLASASAVAAAVLIASAIPIYRLLRADPATLLRAP